MADTPRLEGRTGEIWRMTLYGKTQEAIAEKFGISQVRVGQIIKEVQAQIPKPDKDALIQREIAFLESIRDRTEELAESPLPPAFDQKGYILKDEKGGVVRDASGRVTALKLHLDVQARLAKMVGLEAPTKTDITVNDLAKEAAAKAAADALTRLHGDE